MNPVGLESGGWSGINQVFWPQMASFVGDWFHFFKIKWIRWVSWREDWWRGEFLSITKEAPGQPHKGCGSRGTRCGRAFLGHTGNRSSEAAPPPWSQTLMMCSRNQGRSRGLFVNLPSSSCLFSSCLSSSFSSFHHRCQWSNYQTKRRMNPEEG